MNLMRKTAIFCAVASLASAGPAIAQDQQVGDGGQVNGEPTRQSAAEIDSVGDQSFFVVNGLDTPVTCQLGGNGRWFTLQRKGGQSSWPAEEGSRTTIFCKSPVIPRNFAIYPGRRNVIEMMPNGQIGVTQDGG